MRKTTALSLAVMALAVAVVPAAPAAASSPVTVGQNDSGNCYPFSCFASDSGGTTYQQVYSASAFSGISTFDTVSFFLREGGLMDTADYNISFYLTPNGPGTLSSNASSNRGAFLGNLGSFSVGGSMPSELAFNGAAFTYDPAAGNLLMEVNVLGLFEAHQYTSFFQADYTGTTTSRYFAYGGSGTGSTATGALVTKFQLLNAVPEPATWGMMILGFGVMGAAMRRRNAQVRVTYA